MTPILQIITELSEQSYCIRILRFLDMKSNKNFNLFDFENAGFQCFIVSCL